MALALVSLGLNWGCAAVVLAGGGVPYNHYQYNYPHEIPPDYAYRTGRVVSPVELELGSKGGSSSSAQGEEGGRVSRSWLGREVVVGMVGELLAGNGGELRGEYTLAVTTPVSLGNLYATSSFGRLVAERMLGELQRAGVAVVDVRKTPALLITPGHGEYGLSRDLDELPYTQDVQAVLVGSYTVTGARVMLDLRVLRNGDGRVLSATSRDFDMNSELALLLADESHPIGEATPMAVRDYHEPTDQAR